MWNGTEHLMLHQCATSFYVRMHMSEWYIKCSGNNFPLCEIWGSYNQEGADHVLGCDATWTHIYQCSREACCPNLQDWGKDCGKWIDYRGSKEGLWGELANQSRGMSKRRPGLAEKRTLPLVILFLPFFLTSSSPPTLLQPWLTHSLSADCPHPSPWLSFPPFTVLPSLAFGFWKYCSWTLPITQYARLPFESTAPSLLVLLKGHLFFRFCLPAQPSSLVPGMVCSMSYLPLIPWTCSEFHLQFAFGSVPKTAISFSLLAC